MSKAEAVIFAFLGGVALMCFVFMFVEPRDIDRSLDLAARRIVAERSKVFDLLAQNVPDPSGRVVLTKEEAAILIKRLMSARED